MVSTVACALRARMSAAIVGAAATLWPAAGALADHGDASRAAPMSPLLTALVSGGLALLTGLLVLAVLMRLTRRVPPGGDGTRPK
jgi:hypothetical protein